MVQVLQDKQLSPVHPTGLLESQLPQIERLSLLINEVLNSESLTNLYKLILDQTIEYFGFDYGAISRVDYNAGRVRTEIGKSRKASLADPNKWKAESDYSLGDKDILVDVVKNRRSEIILGPDVVQNWDDRLNRKIFEEYNHKDLVRVFVPFIIRKVENTTDDDGSTKKIVDEKVLGVIEAGYHITTSGNIPDQQRVLFELFINYCAGAFQKLVLLEEKATVDRILNKLNAQESLLSSAAEIYAVLIEVLEEYLKVDTVSIWERTTASEPLTLRRVAASKFLAEQYDKEDIHELPQDSFTAEAIKKGVITEATFEQMRGPRFAYPQIALKNKFDSMIIVPISIGQEPYAVVDVFFGVGRKLTTQERQFLKHFANRATVAMLAIQNAKLIDSFSKISERLVDEDIEPILQSITDSALEVLHANPVILYRYEASRKRFMPDLITSGDFFYPEVKNMPKIIKENDWPSIILNMDHASHYIETEQQYLTFQKQINRVWRGDRFTQDFWYREKIKSLAALRLQHRNESVGIMFVNYRTSQKFNEPTRKLIEAFAAQAASAISRNRQFWETHRTDSFSLSINEIVASLSHNAANLLNVADVRFARFDSHLKKLDSKTVEKASVQTFLSELKEPWDEILADFNRLEEYRKFDEFLEEANKIEDVIDDSLLMLRHKFEKQKITIKKNYAPNTPLVMCDSHQVQHMLLNLFLNAVDAMGKRGILSVGTDVRDRYLRIRVTDSGTGIPQELHSQIFKPFFTTKKHGSGLGLPISRYIARKHKGRIDFSSKPGKESTFLIYLPLERKTDIDAQEEGENSPNR